MTTTSNVQKNEPGRFQPNPSANLEMRKTKTYVQYHSCTAFTGIDGSSETTIGREIGCRDPVFVLTHLRDTYLKGRSNITMPTVYDVPNFNKSLISFRFFDRDSAPATYSDAENSSNLSGWYYVMEGEMVGISILRPGMSLGKEDATAKMVVTYEFIKKLKGEYSTGLLVTKHAIFSLKRGDCVLDHEKHVFVSGEEPITFPTGEAFVTLAGYAEPKPSLMKRLFKRLRS